MDDSPMSDPTELPYVNLNRDLLESLPGENYAQFTGEWSPDEKDENPGWETFTVMLHGEDAADSTEATWDDLRRIAIAYLVLIGAIE